MSRPSLSFSFLKSKVIFMGFILALSLFVGFSLVLKTPATTEKQWLEALLSESWQYYKTHMMVNTERVESNHYKGTISEGQSYALLKSVWMDDQRTFERTWQWTQAHMRRPNDRLFGWRWGRSESGVEQLLEIENATDADQDIAYALLLASEQWNVPEYRVEAQAIIKDLWRLNVQTVNGKYYLNPGTWEAFQQDYLTLNPSYFAPYVYRTFSRYDAEHAKGWRALAQNIYPTLEACSNLTKNKLPPNWCSVNWETGKISWSDKQGEGSRDFSYDAFRVFWRMAMDASLDDSGHTGKARQYLASHQALQRYWKKHHFLPEGFYSDGTPRTQGHSSNPSSGFALGALLAQNHELSPKALQSLYDSTLKPYYHGEGYWFNSYNDFLHSVIWFHLYTLKPMRVKTKEAKERALL